jgi:ribosomal-protein-alanine N-acetyltransferase
MSAVLSDAPLPELAFRPLLEDDIAEVAAIEEGVYQFPWSAGNFRDSLLSGYQCWGCRANGELIAYAIVMNALDEAHLLNLAVAGDWQRHGVGARFIAFLIDEARKLNKEMIYLEVRPSNHAGRRLYAQFGFIQLGLRRGYYPAPVGREDALFLGLNIAPKRI